MSTVKHLSEKEQQCEDFYKQTHTLDKDGRYTVRRPFRLEPSKNLSLNMQAATAIQLFNEKKAALNQALKRVLIPRNYGFRVLPVIYIYL